MRRYHIVVLAGSLLVAGSAGTASASQPEERRPGAMPHVMPQEPGPAPIPRLRPAKPGPVPMPQVEAGPPLADGLDHRRGRSSPQPLRLPDELDPGTGAVLP